MSTSRNYYVYILSNKRNGTLYIGVTNSLDRRMYEHKTKSITGFAQRYGLDKLVYYDQTHDINEAIAFEKKLKGWTRKKKLTLIEVSNPLWNDLASELDSSPPAGGSK